MQYNHDDSYDGSYAVRDFTGVESSDQPFVSQVPRAYNLSNASAISRAHSAHSTSTGTAGNTSFMRRSKAPSDSITREIEKRLQHNINTHIAAGQPVVLNDSAYRTKNAYIRSRTDYDAERGVLTDAVFVEKYTEPSVTASHTQSYTLAPHAAYFENTVYSNDSDTEYEPTWLSK